MATNSRSRLLAVWAAHMLTMSGLLWLMLALNALYAGDLKAMWLWLGVSLVVDAADGPLARRAGAAELVPWFSGYLMDCIIDYTTWTLVPALFMAKILPFGGPLAGAVAAVLALTSSMFCYANNNMKSHDWYFVGFPAAWNIVAVILWLFGSGALFNWTIVLIFSVLALIPFKWVHPFRVRNLRWLNASCAAIWIATTTAWVALYPQRPGWVFFPWLASGLWILVISALRSIRGPVSLGLEGSAEA